MELAKVFMPNDVTSSGATILYLEQAPLGTKSKDSSMQTPSSGFIAKWKEVISTEIGFLLFRRVKPDLKRLGNHYLLLGVISAWLVGIGRYWDNPRAEWWQYAGLGSVAYIFVLALILWLLIMPMRPKGWSYKTVLIFVGMTSPPAIFYAIPVERFFSMSTAQTMNVWFLAAVALWRVQLLFRFLKFSAGLSGLSIFVAALLPLTIIVTALTFLNLEHVVFNIMAGIAPEDQSANDASYGILFLITAFSMLASPVLFVLYVIECLWAYKHKSRTKE